MTSLKIADRADLVDLIFVIIRIVLVLASERRHYIVDIATVHVSVEGLDGRVLNAATLRG